MTVGHRKDKVVVVGPLPPPAGGVTSFTSFLLSSSLSGDFQLIHVDISRKNGLLGAGAFNLSNLAGFLGQAIRLWKTLARHRPAVVHLPMTSYLSFWKEAFFIAVCRVFRPKIIIHLHGGSFIRFYRTSGILARKLIRSAFRAASAIITLSAGWKADMQSVMQIDRSIEVIPNTVEGEFYREINALKNGHTGSGRGKTVLFMGQLTPKKGIFDIARAIPLVLQEMADATFVIAGPEGRRGARERIMGLTGSCRENIVFTGEIRGAEKYRVFAEAGVFILPSYVENFSISILEAMAAGLPIVTTTAGANGEILQEGRNCFFIPAGDHRRLADRIVALLRDEDLSDRFGRNNRREFEEKFSPDQTAGKIRALYRRLCDGREPSPQADPTPSRM